MQGERRFRRETGELWQIRHFRDGLKHGEWLRRVRGGSVGCRKRFETGKHVEERPA